MEKAYSPGKWMKVVREGSGRTEYVNLANITSIVMYSDTHPTPMLYVDDTQLYVANISQDDVDAALLSDGPAILTIRKVK